MRGSFPFPILARAMKILFSHEAPFGFAAPMGVERAVRGFSKYLRRLGVDVDVTDPGVEEPSPRGYDALLWIGSFGEKHAQARLVSRAQELEIPVFGIPVYWTDSPNAIRVAIDELGWKNAQALAYLEFRWKNEMQTARVCAGSSALFPNAPRERDRLRALLQGFGLRCPPMWVVWNAIDPEELAPLELPPWESRGKLVVHAARIEVLKGFPNLVRAMDFVHYIHPDAHLLMMGRIMVPDISDYLRPWVTFTGEVPPGDVLKAFAQARVHVLPSYRDTPGLAQLEAAALGCNVVSSYPQYGTAPDYFGPLARYVDPDSPAMIAGAIHKSLTEPPDPELAKKVRETFTWEQGAREIWVRIEETLRGTLAPGPELGESIGTLKGGNDGSSRSGATDASCEG